MSRELSEKFERFRPTCRFASLRWVRDTRETLVVRRRQERPVYHSIDEGVMVTVHQNGGFGYAATSDLSHDGIYHAFTLAQQWARRSAGYMTPSVLDATYRRERGEYLSRVERPWEGSSRREKFALLRDCADRMQRATGIIDAQAMLTRHTTESLLLTSEGTEVRQRLDRLLPHLMATAQRDGVSQTRTFGRSHGRQGGLEVLDEIGFAAAAERIAAEALELADAPPCPTGNCDLVIGPAQMGLQIHETIGHPLELDRILGEERNYAGGSFVRRDDFGTLRYGSPALNVSFDPAAPGALASYGFDDEGLPAERVVLIRDGLLLRGIGGAASQTGLGVAGCASARAAAWNRPPIDRMGNVMLEAGDASFDDLIGAVENGLYLDDFNSWSIDDTRLRFQFGCEWGRRIEHGRLTHLVRGPGYRGTTPQLWNRLERAGDASTYRWMSTPHCGKGEPHQMITAAHGAPVCLFRDIEVFGPDLPGRS